MKNKILIFIFSFLLFSVVFFSCKKDIKQCQGEVKNINDSTLVMTMADGDYIFDIKRAEYDNGAIICGDSIKINYIGDFTDGDTARALLIYLIPPKGTIIDDKIDTTKELITEPATKDNIKKIDEFVKVNSKK